MTLTKVQEAIKKYSESSTFKEDSKCFCGKICKPGEYIFTCISAPYSDIFCENCASTTCFRCLKPREFDGNFGYCDKH